MMTKSYVWKSVKNELPNEDEIPYTTHVAVNEERNVSDKVLIVTKDAEVYTAFFMHTGKRHPYYGSCARNQWSYPPHLTPFEAGWECCADKNGWGERYEPLFWTELPSLSIEKIGRWEHGICSICGFDWSTIAPVAGVMEFCPNCGTKMVGDTE